MMNVRNEAARFGARVERPRGDRPWTRRLTFSRETGLAVTGVAAEMRLAVNTLAAALLVGEVLRPDFVARVAFPPLVAGIWLTMTLLLSRMVPQPDSDWRRTRWLVLATAVIVGSLAWVVFADVPDHRLPLTLAAAAIGGAVAWESYNSR